MNKFTAPPVPNLFFKRCNCRLSDAYSVYAEYYKQNIFLYTCESVTLILFAKLRLNLTSSTLESRIKQLPSSFKSELTPDVKNQLLYEFHSASYNTLNDIETFLLMVLNLLVEIVKTDGCIPELENMTIAFFMMQHYEVNDFQSVMDKLILSFGSQQQQKLLESFTLEISCRIAEFFHDWLEKGFYNYCGIPKYFKRSMETSVKSELEVCLFKTKTDNKLIKVKKELDDLSSRLKIVHNELLKTPDEVLVS